MKSLHQYQPPGIGNGNESEVQSTWKLPELIPPDEFLEPGSEEADFGINIMESDAALYRLKEKTLDESMKTHSILGMMSKIPDSMLGARSKDPENSHFNLLMGDISGSMSSFWPKVVEGWNTHIRKNLVGRTSIVTFGSAVKTENEISQKDFDSSDTDLTSALQDIVKEVYKCNEKIINVFFVTDCNDESQYRPKDVIEKIRVQEGKQCDIYVLGAGKSTPDKYSLTSKDLKRCDVNFHTSTQRRHFGFSSVLTKFSVGDIALQTTWFQGYRALQLPMLFKVVGLALVIGPVFAAFGPPGPLLGSYGPPTLFMELSATQSMTALQHKNITLLRMIDEVVHPTIHTVFTKLIWEAKKDTETLKEFMFSQHDPPSNKDYKKDFNQDQREKIERDPSCITFDMPLYYKSFTYTARFNTTLKSDPTLTDRLRINLKGFKGLRNHIAHNPLKVPEAEIPHHINNMELLMDEFLDLIGDIFGHRYTTDAHKGHVLECMNGIKSSQCRDYDNSSVYRRNYALFLSGITIITLGGYIFRQRT